jgi:hypothetical protein
MKTGLLWLAMTLSTQAALAARNGVVIGQDTIPTVSVESTDGHQYNRLRGPTHAMGFKISGQCPSNHGVGEANAHALHWPNSTGEADVSELRESDRTLTPHLVWVPHSLTPIEWHASWKQKVIAACNANLSSQTAGNGKTAQQVFAKRWTVKGVQVDQVEGVLVCNQLKSAKGFGFDSSGGEVFRHLNTIKVDVDCEKYLVNDFKAESKPKSPVDDLSNGVHVVQANLTALPKATANGVCGLTLSGVIETDVINATVTLFYRNNKGGTTPWRTVKTDHSKVAFFSDYLDFSKPAGPAESAASPGGGAGGFAATPGKKHNGYYQMIGKNIQFQSNMASFNFDCAKAAPGSIATAPDKPTVPPNKRVPPMSPPPAPKGLKAPTSAPQPLLVPAVQAAREAARRAK